MAVIKESSDELNPPVTQTGINIAKPRARRGVLDYVALALATCGVGYIPLAPGTWGSALGVMLYLLFQMTLNALLHDRNFLDPTTLHLLRTTSLVVLIAIITLAGTWAATRTEELMGRKDPGLVVVDEVAGQLIAFIFIPASAGRWAIVAGFVLFRLFDIWKPYPVRRLERLESGLGIMFDDVFAGIYAAIVLGLAWLASAAFI